VLIDRIAYESSDGSVYTVNRDGTARIRVSQDPGSFEAALFPPTYIWPTWSHDSADLLFTALTADFYGIPTTSLLRAPAAGDSAPVLLHLDIQGATGITTGVPHYSSWRPDDEHILLITDAVDVLGTFMVDADDGSIGPGVSNQAPVYLDWSHDSRYLLVHVAETLLLHEFRADGTRPSINRIGSGSVSYRAPDFSPVANEYLYVDFVDDVRTLYLGSVGAEGPVPLMDTAFSSAFRWSPDGDRFALAQAERSSLYESVQVMDKAGAPVTEAVTGEFLAFWWSPDSKKLLTASLEGSDSDQVRLEVLDVATGQVSGLGSFLPSLHTSVLIDFFDQYDTTHSLWSPDSRHVVFSGLRADPGPQRPGFDPDGSNIWVLDTAGEEPPFWLGAGAFATWSPL
jgi:Tol biopolymer transport system component